jgi:hypothetical protein
VRVGIFFPSLTRALRVLPPGGLDAMQGLCCPVGLSEVLTRAFHNADVELLAWLQRALQNPKP